MFGPHRAADTAGAVVGPLGDLALYEALDHRLRPLFWVAVIPAVASVLLVAAVSDPGRRAGGASVKAVRTPWRSLPRPYGRVLGVLLVFSLVNFPDALLLLRAHELGVSATRYILIFATNAAGMLLASWTFGALSRRLPVGTLLTAGVAVALVGTLLQVALIAADGGGLAGTWACLFVTLFGIGTVFPASMTLGQSLGRKASGAASALLGGVEFLLGALASPLVGVFGTGSPMPMAVIMLSAILCAALVLVCLGRPLWTHGALPRQRDAAAS